LSKVFYWIQFTISNMSVPEKSHASIASFLFCCVDSSLVYIGPAIVSMTGSKISP
jgi:hypothetical protein